MVKRAVISELLQFIRTDIWRIRLKELSKRKSFGIRLLRIILLASRGFREGRIHLTASALTLYTLLSIVPVFALAFGIAKGFGFEKSLQQDLLERFQGQQEVVTRVIEFANTLLEATKGGLIAGIGLVVLFWAVLRVLKDVENAFNHIWGIEDARSFGRKFSDYLTILIVSPILLVMSSSITIFISSQVTAITEKVELLGYFSPFIFFLLKTLPYCVIWALFSFIYILVPNTKVNFRSGVLAGIIAGSAFQVVQWGYIHFQVGVAKYNAIYGSFAALPLFLIWLQMSWLIVLGGAEVSCAHQTMNQYEFEPDFPDISARLNKLLALRIAHLIITRFADGKPPLTADQVSKTLKLPIRQVRHLLEELTKGRILSTTGNAPAFQPAMDIQRIRINHILNALENRGNDALPPFHEKALASFSQALHQFNVLIDASPANRLLKDI